MAKSVTLKDATTQDPIYPITLLENVFDSQGNNISEMVSNFNTDAAAALALMRTQTAASTTTPGLMSAEDKAKLDGIATGATANTGTVTSITVGEGGTNYTANNGVVTIPAYPTTSIMGASGSTHAAGLVPDTPTTAGTTKFLREDGSWATPSGGNVSYENINYSADWLSDYGAIYIDPNIQCHEIRIGGDIYAIHLSLKPGDGKFWYIVFYNPNDSTCNVSIEHEKEHQYSTESGNIYYSYLCKGEEDTNVSVPAYGSTVILFFCSGRTRTDGSGVSGTCNIYVYPI